MQVGDVGDCDDCGSRLRVATRDPLEFDPLDDDDEEEDGAKAVEKDTNGLDELEDEDDKGASAGKRALADAGSTAAG